MPYAQVFVGSTTLHEYTMHVILPYQILGIQFADKHVRALIVQGTDDAMAAETAYIWCIICGRIVS